MDIGKGLACRDSCEDDARALVRLIDYNIECANSIKRPTAELLPPTRIVQDSSDQSLSINLDRYAEASRRSFRWIGWLQIVIGMATFVGGGFARTHHQKLVAWFVGVAFVVTGLGLLFRRRLQPTSTRSTTSHSTR